uniref:Uncharacterized protein n=1 Tax=Rhizophora mucronata TaxID=61149 RepID=A0A2P2P4A4_RHIMU
MESTIATVIYNIVRTLESPNQTLMADRCGIKMASMKHTNPAIRLQYESFIPSLSFKRT